MRLPLGSFVAGLVGLGVLVPSAAAEASWSLTATLTTPAEFVDADDDSFGGSVTCGGNRVFVGAVTHADRRGAVYVFAADDGAFLQRIEAPVDSTQRFGMVQGADEQSLGVNGGDFEDEEFHFLSSGEAGFGSPQTLDLTEDQREGAFGFSAVIRGDLALVGAPRESNATGKVYVYRRESEIWQEEAILAASDEQTGNYFGLPLAFDGSTAVVGAARNSSGPDEFNAAYVFVRAADGGWSQEARLSLSEPDEITSLNFGSSVAVLDDTAAVGAAPDRVNVYVRQGDDWTQTATLRGEDESFGFDLMMQRDVLWVQGRTGEQHSLYTFERDADSWQETDRLGLLPNERADYAICGQTLIRTGANQATLYHDTTLPADVAEPESAPDGGAQDAPTDGEGELPTDAAIDAGAGDRTAAASENGGGLGALDEHDEEASGETGSDLGSSSDSNAVGNQEDDEDSAGDFDDEATTAAEVERTAPSETSGHDSADAGSADSTAQRQGARGHDSNGCIMTPATPPARSIWLWFGILCLGAIRRKRPTSAMAQRR